MSALAANNRWLISTFHSVSPMFDALQKRALLDLVNRSFVNLIFMAALWISYGRRSKIICLSDKAVGVITP